MSTQIKEMQKEQEIILTSYKNSEPPDTVNSDMNFADQSSVEQTTVVAFFDTPNGADKAVSELRRQGFLQEEINIISKDQSGTPKTGRYEDDITDGALTGSTLGGIGGLLAGAGALVIPGIGPIVAAGPIVGALSGALAGGITGGLIDWGIPAEASHRYEASVSQGNILAIIKTDQKKVNQVSSVLKQFGANNIEIHNI